MEVGPPWVAARVISANSRVDAHVHVCGLIRSYREGLWHCADVSVPAVLDIQNIISRKQCDAIISILVRYHVGDFFSSVTA